MMILIVLAVTFAFGIGTLWIEAQWPFVVLQAVILSVACVSFARTAWTGTVTASRWLLVPFAMPLLGLVQILSNVAEVAWVTRMAVLQWFTHACAAWIAFQLCRDSRLRNLALRFFACGAGALALLSVVQNYASPGKAFGIFDTRYENLVFGPFVYHNKAAQFAELAFPAAVWLALTEQRGRSLYACACVALAGLVVASGSRAGIAILCVQVLLLGGLIWQRHRSGLRCAAALVGMVACGAGLFGWELAAARLGIDYTRDLRLPILASSLEMAKRYWITGAGLGAWSSVYPEFARFDAHLFINQAHCDWLQWLIEGGVIAFTAMLLVMTAAVRAARYEYWSLGLVFVWMHGILDYPMQQSAAFVSLQFAFWGATVALLEARRVTMPRKTAGGSREAEGDGVLCQAFRLG